MDQHTRQVRTAEVLLVEDNRQDVILTQQAFKQAHVDIQLHHVQNGLDCLSFLRKKGDYKNVTTPDIVLLDLNLPGMDGREVLEEISGDEALSHLPVVVLTTSADEKDIYKMYHLRCSSYIVKPVDFPQFLHVIKELSEYWFTVVALPSFKH